MKVMTSLDVLTESCKPSVKLEVFLKTSRFKSKNLNRLNLDRKAWGHLID